MNMREPTKFIAGQWLDEWHFAPFIVELNMDDVRQKVWKARKFIRENKDEGIYHIRFFCSDPTQISMEHWEKYQETEGYGDGEMYDYDPKILSIEGKISEKDDDLRLRYGILVVEESMVSYECMPKHWDATAKCYFSEKWFE